MRKITSKFPVQRTIVSLEGTYEDISEWDVEIPTEVDYPSTLEATVHGPPKSEIKINQKASIEEILRWYIND